ncbi:protein transport protein BOS1 [Yarrowia lipolytica]|jgi:Golgi SNAP receptor complex protein 2|uniref:Protein transport protein BOS1 n=2 Tax=Yarrowia lipolytica TaxID=4952 RepID=BOS1_YARLI|nr:YALI0F31669p [Yarrowia lipolytica CLIB122]Q6BZQ6.1 RecName: Full=Protein transport protein BOS1 [Yarrowia lipolytica CLIB122]AOW07969.1 hypothetical protein YALI1_F39272g [Yarrowia lipolytica]KAB8282357.1 protein transport protein BOS1 [Yarrowia lipolytica]KAE8172257.1 protein transport protein BOS1 [Yarrowia lipolytica]KAJ8054998.1 protein transport protein BOS1 [Yarrowia lipolytica]QNP99565.1 Protein transport protein BOS1 [Yarrowia lipolytica]|eukprot:XP_506106.1 YALI0F31669p [Yarrowia lipolytica CLIB122]
MNAIHNHLVKQNASLKKDLSEFSANPAGAPMSLQGQISATMTSFSRTLDDYSEIINKEHNKEKKEKAEARLARFREELADARSEFKNLRSAREEKTLEENKTALFGDNPYGESRNRNVNRDVPIQPTYTDLTREEGMQREQSSLNQVGQQLDSFIEQGMAALGDLQEQSDILRSTGKKMRSVAETLGLSRETIKMVEKRARQDKRFFYGGIVFMLVCFYYILKWFS